jgi:hypothetical protein
MHIRVFSTSQCRHVSSAVYEYWESARSNFRIRAIHMKNQLRSGNIDEFRAWVQELVCPFLSIISLLSDFFI